MRRVAVPHDGGEPAPSREAAEIEREIGCSRRRIDITFNVLARRLAPARLIRDGMAAVSRFAGVDARVRSDGAPGLRLDPVAIGLIGTGIAWLVAQNVRRLRRQKPDGGTGAVGAGLESDQFAGSAGGTAAATVGAAEPCAATEKPAAEFASGLIESNPIFVGLVGLALGGALAALLPPSAPEKESFARAREGLWQAAEAFGHRTAARLRNVGHYRPAAPTEHSPAE